VQQLKDIIGQKNSYLKVMAKIEKPEALKEIDEIIKIADGIMIARGDLAVEVPQERMPLIQKDIVKRCIKQAKPVVVATQMMESMIESPTPTRAEITDVANAAIDGADAVMLSAETSTGKYPLKVIQVMSKILKNIEDSSIIYDKELRPDKNSPTLISDAICYNACKMARDVNAEALIGMTQSGYTGFMLSSFRPSSPLFVFSKEKTLINQLSLSWGVRAFYYDEEESVDGIITDQINILKERGFLQPDNIVINTGSIPVSLHLPTNMIKVTKVI